jgi:integrase
VLRLRSLDVFWAHKKPRRLARCETALRALKDWRAQFPNAQLEHYVFPSESYGLMGKEGEFGGRVAPYETFPDRPIGSWKTAWKSAKKAAGVKCRWHDMRHTAVSRVAAGGATDGTLQDIFGWMSPEMIRRYSHIGLEAKRQAVAVLDGPRNRKRSPQNPPQRVRSPQRHSNATN